MAGKRKLGSEYGILTIISDKFIFIRYYKSLHFITLHFSITRTKCPPLYEEFC